jgi:anti-anti-sigma factor
MLQIKPHTIDLVGDFDISNATPVREVFDAVQAAVRIDLSQTTFIDASILSEFARLAARISPHKATLVGLSPHVRRILDVVDFHSILDY